MSTDQEEQLLSYENQVNYYTNYISENPLYEYAGTYADEGISGTNTKKRDEFNRMIADCRAGKIDMIITKSISRFARNTLDCLNYVRELKDLGIGIIFEKENINTLDAKGEVLLTILSSLAQDESRSISENCTWGIRRRFETGKHKMSTKRFLGYDTDETGKLVINRTQEPIVVRLYQEFLDGKRTDYIKRIFEREGVKNWDGGTKWQSTTLMSMLENEKYKGDALLQKSYTVDFLTKKRTQNKGEIQMFYVEDDHDAIISKRIWECVQLEIKRRKKYLEEHGTNSYSHRPENNPFASKIICGDCNKVFARKGWRSSTGVDRNGRTFPLYCYDSDKVAALEIENQRGDTEYLYLPTDICSVNKMKARLQVQDFWECKVKEVHNFHIPDSILPRPEDIKCIEDLTFFNELCQNICRFDEQKMKQLSMAVEFVGVKDFTDMTYIARTLSEFEIHSDEEYGKYLVSDEGLFDVDDLLLSHIDYAGLARDKRQGTLTDSGYVSEGFVGANRDIHEYMEYEGEFADPLEIDEDCFQTFRLFSPLTGQLYVDGEDARNLYRSDLTPYEEEIMEAIRNEECIGEEARGLMHYFDESREVAGKVLRATPAVQVLNGELYGVLECKISEPMTEEDIKVLKDYWTGQMSEGWGEGFEQHPIKIDEGELYVSVWNSESFWSVMTAEELAVMQEQADYSDCGL